MEVFGIMKLITKTILFIFFIWTSIFHLFVLPTLADSIIDNGINYLKSKQDSSGKITTGFSAPSQWTAIAFTANEIDITLIKNPEKSLKDFLLTDIPNPGSATDWENRILAIVAIGENPANFGGINYIQNLETFFQNSQIDDVCSVNDDIFGLLALISSGALSNFIIKQVVLDFIISKQDPDGGFGFSVPGCAWYSTSVDMTAAAIQAFRAAKDNTLINANLDDAISKAQNYLLTNQNSDGGFGYFGSSDTDTTGWVLMAFNALGLKDSQFAVNAKNWLVSKQSSSDGGFLSYDYGLGSFVSNSTTTAQALTALSGKSWILKTFIPVASQSATPSAAPISTPTPFPTASPVQTVIVAPTSTPSPSPSSTPLPSSSPSPTLIPNVQLSFEEIGASSSPEPIAIPEILGEKTISPKKPQSLVNGFKENVFPMIFLGSLFISSKFIERRWIKC